MEIIPSQDPSGASSVPAASNEGGSSSETAIRWMKRLLACNPFYLVSAALLLFGIYRLSVDPTFLSGEIARLIFNFSALQFYSALLVVTAILLATQRIWYDSTLLVFLESKFVLLPFILLSLAAWDRTSTAYALCAIGGALAIARFLALKRYYRQLNLPPQLLVLGVVLLVVNIGMAIGFKHLHEVRDGAVAPWTYIGWTTLLPLLMAFAILLPKPHRRGELLPERPWLPLSFYATWIAVSGAHLWSLNYIYDVGRDFGLWAPVLWVGAWVLVLRVKDVVAESTEEWRQTFLGLPVAATFVAVFHENSAIFFALSTLNAVTLGVLWLRARENRVAFQLALLSLATTFGGSPSTFDTSRENWIVLAAAAYGLLHLTLARNPKAGLAGAIGVGIGTVMLVTNASVGFAIQNTFVYLLLHSLRWDDSQHEGATMFRVAVAVVWISHSIGWVVIAGDTASAAVEGYGATVLTVYLVRRLLGGDWGAIVVPFAAVVVMATMPVRMSFTVGRQMPIGLLAMVASLILFAAGTVAAWTKHRWNNGVQEPPAS